MPSRSTSAARRAPRAATSLRPVTSDYVEALKQYCRLLYDGGLHGGKDAKRPEALAAKIEVGRDLGIPATQAIAWIAIINGRPSIYGDLGMGLIRSSGLLADGYPKEWYEGEPGEDSYTACFAIKRTGATPERVVRFSVADAKQARLWGKAGPWSEYPDRQLMWRAKGFACRDEFQDVLCGLIFAEEALDLPTESPRVIVGEATPASTPALPPGQPAEAATTRTPITDAQLDRLAELQDLVFASKGCQTDDERDQAWAAVLAEFGVDSARQLTAGQAAELIEHLEQTQDPFSCPSAGPQPTGS